VQKGWPCLMVAVWEGHLEIVKYLVEVGGKRMLMLVDKVCARACKRLSLSCRVTSQIFRVVYNC
jgi:hypothetical protein